MSHGPQQPPSYPHCVEPASGMWRCEDMALLQIHMQREAAHDTIVKLGQLGMMQFLDLNAGSHAFQRDFATEVRRCDDMERKLRYLSDQISQSSVVAVAETSLHPDTMSSLEQKIDEKESEVRENSSQIEALLAEQNRAREHLEVLMREHGELDEFPTYSNTSSGGVSFVTGVFAEAKMRTFVRLIYRASRGNCFFRSDEIREPYFDPTTHEPITKHVFAIFFTSARIQEKITRICESIGATTYKYAQNRAELQQLRNELRQQLETLDEASHRLKRRQRDVLTATAREITEWKRAVTSEKAVYSTLNFLQFQGSTVIARGWAPVSEIDNVKKALKMGELSSGAQVPSVVEEVETSLLRPTFFKTTKFSSIFQGIVDSYGVSRYKECNPGLLTIITFPYLFGVMYGDIGHGLLLTVVGALLIYKERDFEGKPISEIFSMIFGGRYLLFFMGAFGTYLGLLYNDMFGMSVEVFSSGYSWPQIGEGVTGIVQPKTPNGAPSVKPANPCPFGVDAAWAETENKLEFYNSIKMKCAVIIGVIQMSIGIVISLFNHLYFRDKLAVWLQFVPEILFMSCTFGYMSLIIIVKWATPWENTHEAPSLLETMTNYFLAPGSVAHPLYRGQVVIQELLILVAFLMVPILLGGIPFVKWREHKKKIAAIAGDRIRLASASAQESQAREGDGGGEEDDFNFSDLMIHQVIHTIEFVLGTVSNTASYLRLWALSLAHSQLSEVFLNFAFLTTVGIDDGSGIFIFLGFAVWISVTLGVLLMMEALSAFLHALRLHWVEFQSKFYYGDGIAFAPFDLHAILAEV